MSGASVPVDPQIAAVLAMLESGGVQPMYEGTPEEGRAAFAALTVGLRTPEQLIPVAGTEDVTVPGADGELRARVYRPEGSGPFPTVVFFHGGGWVSGALETQDNQPGSVCRSARTVVVSVDYRLAPEHPFPAAAEDA